MMCNKQLAWSQNIFTCICSDNCLYAMYWYILEQRMAVWQMEDLLSSLRWPNKMEVTQSQLSCSQAPLTGGENRKLHLKNNTSDSSS